MNETIGIKNLEFSLSQHTRLAYEDNWQVGAGATTTSVPVVLRNPASKVIDITGQVQTDLQGVRIEFVSGKNIGVSRIINSAASNGTLTLDSALPNVPAAGDLFILLPSLAKIQLSGSNTMNANVLKITTANTATQLPNIACREITLIGLKANAATVYIGGLNVSSTVYGAAFDPKDSQTFTVSNADMLYIYGAAGDGVSYVAV